MQFQMRYLNECVLEIVSLSLVECVCARVRACLCAGLCVCGCVCMRLGAVRASVSFKFEEGGKLEEEKADAGRRIKFARGKSHD